MPEERDPLTEMQDREAQHIEDWSGNYNGECCEKCSRLRVMLCDNGKRLCEKCRWSPEVQGYIAEWL